jgi:peptidoglycan/LPS O-acetylase OafA/YrhL
MDIRLILNAKWNKTGMGLLAGFVLLSIVLRFHVVDDYFNQTITYAELARLGYDQLYIHLYNFLIGIVIFKWRDKKIKIHSSLIFFLFLVVLVFGYVRINILLTDWTETKLRYYYLLEYAGVLIFGVIIFLLLNSELKGMCYRIVSFISLISYSLYIYHFPILHYVQVSRYAAVASLRSRCFTFSDRLHERSFSSVIPFNLKK